MVYAFPPSVSQGPGEGPLVPWPLTNEGAERDLPARPPKPEGRFRSS
jgi:hypothetical protein